jgi:hypothetical protein
MNNQIETVEVEGGVVSFDHATATMSAVWDNGYTETWPPRGHSYETLYEAFKFFVGRI